MNKSREDVLRELTGELREDERKGIEKLSSISEGVGKIEESELSDEAKKLKSIFRDIDVSKSYYEVDSEGNLILGYEESVDSEGNKIKKPIVQQKVFDIEESAMLSIEVEISDKYLTEKDELGLTREERKRYDKLKALNRGIRSEAELIEKAKNPVDLDSTTVNDMMVHFVTEREEEFSDLTRAEKDNIKKLRAEGMYMDPETISGFHKSVKLASNDGTIHAVNLLKYLTQKGLDLESADTESNLPLYIEMYRKEKRPSIDFLIQGTISDMEFVMYDKLRKMASDDEKDDVEANIKFMQNNEKARMDLLDYFEKNGEHFFVEEDFRKFDTYFRFYGLHEEDSKYFNASYISDPREGVPMGIRFEEFYKATKWKFIDIYKYWWDKIKALKEKEENLKDGNTHENDNTSTISEIINDDDLNYLDDLDII